MLLIYQTSSSRFKAQTMITIQINVAQKTKISKKIYCYYSSHVKLIVDYCDPAGKLMRKTPIEQRHKLLSKSFDGSVALYKSTTYVGVTDGKSATRYIRSSLSTCYQ